MYDILNIHEDRVKLAVALDHVDTFLAIRGIDNRMSVQGKALRQNCAIDIIILGKCRRSATRPKTKTYV